MRLKIFMVLVLVLSVSTQASALWQKCGQDAFMADGTFKKVTCTVTPNVFLRDDSTPDPRSVSITGYSVVESTGSYALVVCEGNTWNAGAEMLVIPPGVPRVSNIYNKLVHQQGLYVRTVGATGTTVTVETWVNINPR